MKLKHLFIPVLAALLVLPFVETFADPASFTIDLLTTFDYPGAGNSTTGVQINGHGEIAGFYQDPSGLIRGFVRFRNGTFSSPIIEPDGGNTTLAFGINDSHVVCGYFVSVADNISHGFFLSGNVFTQFDVPGAVSTTVETIDDDGYFVGSFNDTAQLTHAFVNIDGNTTFIPIPGALFSTAEGINGVDEVVGFYTDSASITHAFFRDATGRRRFPIDFPGATSTVLEAINDQGDMTGRYTDSAGQLHGFFLRGPGTFVSYDYPGATQTALNGINNQGIISGRYTDAANIRHGIVARVRQIPAN